VDDGKSTLIGRLLHDTGAILDDQLEHVVQTSQQRGDEYVNLALLTDGLRMEREQGITIDVAYRYFQTARRKFIIADTPGHEQYTRNMVTGASTADVSVILIDARKGVVEQTRRHAYIASLLRTPHVVVCVNKMDLVDYDEEVFTRIVRELTDWTKRLGIADLTCIPISALVGDNVVESSEQMPWYEGLPVLQHLEEVAILSDRDTSAMRFPVQWVIRPQSHEHHDYRGYAGQLAGGMVNVGQEVVVLPGGRLTKIASIDTYDGELSFAVPPMSVTIRLANEVDVSRGDMLVGIEEQPTVSQEVEAIVCWMEDVPLAPGRRYIVKHTTRTVRAIVEELEHRVDVNTLEREHVAQLELNEIGQIRLRTSMPLMVDPYGKNRVTGSLILIDPATHNTVGAGVITRALSTGAVTDPTRVARAGVV
jgi:sulfate adenylyltransferase large subunit